VIESVLTRFSNLNKLKELNKHTMRVLLLLALVAVAFAAHHGGHRKGGDKNNHNHPAHQHHADMMGIVAELKTCLEDASGDEKEVGDCITDHLSDMKKCIKGLDTNFKKGPGLPKPLRKFVACFAGLKDCKKDATRTDCAEHMIKCVGFKKDGSKKGHHHHKGPKGKKGKKGKKVKGKGIVAHVATPIQVNIDLYIECTKGKEEGTPVEDCTTKYIPIVTDILRWMKLGRCQMGQFLCEALDGGNCLETLTGEKKCITALPGPPPMGAPMAQEKATMFTKMAAARMCLKTERSSTMPESEDEPDNSRYVDCVYESDWIKSEGRHVYCYGKLKSCDATSTKKTKCIENYTECSHHHENHEIKAAAF